MDGLRQCPLSGLPRLLKSPQIRNFSSNLLKKCRFLRKPPHISSNSTLLSQLSVC